MHRPVCVPFAVLLLMVTGAAVPVVAQDKPKPAPKHMVRFSFKKGAVRHSMLLLEMSIKVNLGGKKTDQDMQASLWLTTTVKSTRGNMAQIEQVITRVKIRTNGIAGNLDYDSETPDSDPGPLKTMASLIGHTIRFQLTDTGKQSDLKLPGTSSETRRSALGIPQVLLYGMTQLPDHPIAIGDNWQTKGESKATLLGPDEATIATDLELLAVGKNSITVRQKQTIEGDQKLPPSLANQDIEIGGTYKLDLRTGTPIEASTITKSVTTRPGPVKRHMTIKQTVKPAPAPKTKRAKPGKQPLD